VQYQHLADKYAPAVPEVAETLAKLQLPPDVQSPLPTAPSVVPLPKRCQSGSQHHQIALLIREGRKAAQHLAAGISEARKHSVASSPSTSASPTTAEPMTAVSTVLERDFTVPGKKGVLACPFSSRPVDVVDGPAGEGERGDDSQDLTGTTVDPTPHKSADPICAAMIEDSVSVPAAASKCPIRFMNKHSPEEIAHYVETHKHEIPRSHEVCVRRYQRSEEQIRKLDAKYGDPINMIKDLSHLHAPMLPSPADQDPEEVDRSSNKRVENWAQTISASDPEQANETPADEDRENHFDRPLRDVRLGESPSRPWGIPVPLMAGPSEDLPPPESPAPAPVRISSPLRAPAQPNTARKCPFDHTKMAAGASPLPKVEATPNPGTAGIGRVTPEQPFTPSNNQNEPPPSSRARPTFINPDTILPKADKDGGSPKMVFNISGPVFIGYPMEQAIQFMQQFQAQQQ